MIRLIKSSFYNEKKTKDRLIKFIKSASWLSFGEACQNFETEFAKFQKRKFCVMVNSGSSANLALIQALKNLGRLKNNDAVGFSAVTWSTNVMPLIQLGLRPIPVDIELSTLNVSSQTLENILKRIKIKTLFLTNLLGFCSDIDKVSKLCSKHKITLIEDNCESLGTSYKGRLLGNYGFASTFSFYVGHHMSTVEGGAICTDDENLATMLRIVRAHGWDRNLSERHQRNLRARHKVNSTFYSRYTFYDLGYNLRPTEIQGFLGSLQLKYINKIVRTRNRNFMQIAPKIYQKTDKYIPTTYKHIDFLSNFAIPVVCKSERIRNNLVKKCASIIELRPIVGGDMTKQPYFKKHVKNFKRLPPCPNAELVHKQGLYFGNNPELTTKEKATILKVFTS